jgi:PsbP
MILAELKIMMHLNKICSVALSSCLLWGQIIPGKAIGSPIITSNWKTLTQNNYSLRYPKDWDLQQNESIGSDVSGNTVTYLFAILSPIESPADKFRENVNLVVEDFNGKKVDPDEYHALSRSQIESQMKNCKIIESRNVKKGSQKYHKIIWTWDHETFNLKVEQYVWISAGKAYILTFSSEQNKFAQFQEVGENILNTFTLKK